MTRLFIAGDVTFNGMIALDEFPAPQPGTLFSRGFYETVGGTAAGKALNLNRLGYNVTLHGLIGDDAPGAAVRACFEREALDFQYDLDPQGTQRHINLMDRYGRRISIYVAYATFEPVLDLARLEALIAASDLAVLNLSNYCRRLIPLARRQGKPVWCDIHDYDGQNPYHRDFIEGADVLTMSSDAMPGYRAFMEQQIAAGKALIVCTHGAQGATALDSRGEWVEVPALTDYPLVDSNGAGDAFFAGLLHGYLRGDDLVRSLRLGATMGGLCVTSRDLFHPDLSAALLDAEYARHFGG